MSASPLNRRSAALYGAELTQPGYQQRIAESQFIAGIAWRSAIVDHNRSGSFPVRHIGVTLRSKIWKVPVLPDLRYVFALEW